MPPGAARFFCASAWATVRVHTITIWAATARRSGSPEAVVRYNSAARPHLSSRIWHNCDTPADRRSSEPGFHPILMVLPVSNCASRHFPLLAPEQTLAKRPRCFATFAATASVNCGILSCFGRLGNCMENVHAPGERQIRCR